MKRWLVVSLAGFFASSAVQAQCVLSNADIVNTSDPACAGRMLTYTESAAGPDLIPLGYTVPVPVSSLTPVDGFRTYDSLLALHQDLALTAANVRADRIGSTLSGRDIWAYSIGDADNLTMDGLVEPAVMAIGGIHAREWQTPEAVSALIETLAAAADDEWLGSYLRDNLSVVLIPVLNIDGFLQTQTHPDRVSADPEQPREGRMRRRNLRNPNTNLPIDNTIDTTSDNLWGVDLNRNAPQGWGLNGGSSPSVTSLVYRGPTAASEPEVQALQNAAILAPGDRLRLYMDVHSFSQIYLAPSTGNPRRDAYTSVLASSMRAVQGFKYGYSADPFDGGIGTTADWFAYTFEIPSWTLETEPRNGGQQYGGTASHGHSGFILPNGEVDRMRNEIVASSLIGFYRQAGPPHVTAVRIRDVDTDELRYDAEWENGNLRTLSVTRNSALLPGGNYRLWIAFSKPMRMLTLAGDAGNYPGQQTSPGSGNIELQLPELEQGNDVEFDLSKITWFDQPDGASDGYRRYVFDAASIDFSISAGLSVDGSEPAVLSVSLTDMSDFQIDGNPATPVDWQNGRWSGYENEDGVALDRGGIDCQVKPFVAMDPGAPAPAEKADCRQATSAPPSPPPPTPAQVSSGGGGSAFWLCLVLLPVLRKWRLRRRQKFICMFGELGAKTMKITNKLVFIVLIPLSIPTGSTTEFPEGACPITPKLDIVSAIAPAAGEYPVWVVDGSYGRWPGPDELVKTAWILARNNPGDLTVVAKKLESDDRALFRMPGSTGLVDRLVIADADHPKMIPGEVSPDTLRTYSFRSSAVVYPSAGCWEFSVTYGERRSTIVLRLADD